jgi:hypothetical protein
MCIVDGLESPVGVIRKLFDVIFNEVVDDMTSVPM